MVKFIAEIILELNQRIYRVFLTVTITNRLTFMANLKLGNQIQ